MRRRRISIVLAAVALTAAFAVPPAEAKRKLTVTALQVPATGQAGEPLAISGTVRNAGDERARATVRAYLVETVGQLRLGGRKLGLRPGKQRGFEMSPALPNGADDGEYEVAVCVRRVNKHGPERCRAAPLTIEG